MSSKFGPKGGTTTVTRTGHVKKNLWLPADMAEELRRKAFELRIAEAEIIRRALAKFLPTLCLTLSILLPPIDCEEPGAMELTQSRRKTVCEYIDTPYAAVLSSVHQDWQRGASSFLQPEWEVFA